MTYEQYIELKDKAKVTDYRVAKDCKLGNAFFYKWRTGMISPKESTFDKINEYLKNTRKG